MDLGLTATGGPSPGGGAGRGRAPAAAFAREGALVAAADLRPDAVESLAGAHPPVVHRVDLVAPGAVEAWVGDVVARTGRVDVLVNNVGVAPFRDGFLATTDAQWRHTLDVNLFVMARACRSVLPHMVAAGGGALVNLASDAGRQPDPFFVDYAVSKAAVLSLSKSLSIEFGPHGVRSNCVCPGPTLTPAMEVFLDDLARDRGVSREDAQAHFATDMRRLPLGRLNDPAEVAAVVLFLASTAAAQVTGAA